MASRHKQNAKRLVSRDRNTLQDLQWWRKDEPHAEVWDAWRRLGKQGAIRSRRAQDLYFACLYDDTELGSMLGAQGEFTPQTLSCNIVRRQVDTYTAKISKNRPVPMGLTSGGNYSQQRRAKALSKFFAGTLDETQFWDTRTKRIRDGAIFGSGFALNYRAGTKLVHDRAFPFEFRVDPRDALYGKPRTLMLGRWVDRLVLIDRFPKLAEQIWESEGDSDDGLGIGYDETSNLTFVVTAWHLPSGDGADDGAHVICTSNATLSSGDYHRDCFPISKADYSPPVFGWYGEGMVKQLAGLQYEVNSIGLLLQERHYLMGTYIAREANSGMEMVDNGTLTELIYSGVAPQFLTPPASHPDLLNWFQMLRNQMPGEITGISGLSSRSEKPAGLDSGKAVRTFHEIDSENLTPQGRGDEQDVIDTCWQFFYLAEEIYSESKEDGESYVVRVEQRDHGKSCLEKVDYAKVRLDKDEFTLSVFPTNFLRGTPEEQMQAVQEMIEAGFLSQDEATALLDFPDLQRVLNLRTSARHVIEKILEGILDASDPDAAYVYPEPAMNLELCQALALQTYLEHKLEGAPERNLAKVLQFATDAADVMAQGTPPAGAPAPAPPPDPSTYAPPVDPLLPQGAVAPEAIAPLPMVAA